jgi:hypothetical protein
MILTILAASAIWTIIGHKLYKECTSKPELVEEVDDLEEDNDEEISPLIKEVHDDSEAYKLIKSALISLGHPPKISGEKAHYVLEEYPDYDTNEQLREAIKLFDKG